MVDQPPGHQHVQHPEGQGAVRAGEQLHVLVAGGRRHRAERVDADDPCAGGARLLQDRPEVAVGDEGVGAPEQDHPAVAEVFGVDPDAGALGHPQARRRRCCRTGRPTIVLAPRTLNSRSDIVRHWRIPWLPA